MIIGSDYIFLESVGSTNTHASACIDAGHVPEGTVFYAGFQTGGRGQMGSRWESEKGKNLLFSVVLYPSMLQPSDQFVISMFISLGLIDFVGSYIPCCTVKWPNDIYAGNDKIAGILIENTLLGSSISSTVAGIGININQETFPGYLKNPVSLRLLTGSGYDILTCLKEVAACLDKRYKQVISGDVLSIREKYVSSLYGLDEWRRYRSRNGEFTGRIISVSDQGLLRIETEGEVRDYAFKEVEFI
ncbi:MAG: biotin--[acetyl-CoA-carboxylase] ligase [Bacteroidales bacterium]|jgi:BirA family biotin operon repressor/biotin-[acetyl-CoA-carboxylase] ligase|nr:biotin--[acetyl-CoA-carboxylase] ligase [Bacteroidales bacterium]